MEAKHQIKRGEWIIWGPSMGGAIIYQAMAQNPAMFRQFDHIVLEVPAFASRLTFGAKFLIWLSEQLHKSAIGRAIGRKLIQSYHIIDRRFTPEVVSYISLAVEGFADSYAIFHQNAMSLKHPSNNFDPKILQEIGGTRLLWIWCPNDRAVHAKPPEVIPAKQQLRLVLAHNSSLVAPQEVCQKVDQKFAELK